MQLRKYHHSPTNSQLRDGRTQEGGATAQRPEETRNLIKLRTIDPFLPVFQKTSRDVIMP